MSSGEKSPGDEERVRRMSIIENGKVRMANLAVMGSHHVNGVGSASYRNFKAFGI